MFYFKNFRGRFFITSNIAKSQIFNYQDGFEKRVNIDGKGKERLDR
jgi:hypothetical protein